MMRSSVLVLLAVLAAVLAFGAADNGGSVNKAWLRHQMGLSSLTPPRNRPVDEYGPNIVLNEVSAECRYLWMRKTIVVNQNAMQSMCPFGAFGAIIVNHTATDGPGFSDSQGNWCGKMMGTNHGGLDANDPSAHSEINAIRRLGDAYPGHRFDTKWWGDLTMYTNGESCPMDTAAELWAGFKEVVYSVSIDDLIKCGFGQLDVSSKTLTMRGNTLTQSRITQLIKDVAWADNIKYFCHRYILTNPCPDGCHRNNAGTCVDTNPYVMQPLV